jgi:hypothetical protein
VENADDLRELIVKAAFEGEVIQQNSTEFSQLYKVDWAISNREETVHWIVSRERE